MHLGLFLKRNTVTPETPTIGAVINLSLLSSYLSPQILFMFFGSHIQRLSYKLNMYINHVMVNITAPHSTSFPCFGRHSTAQHTSSMRLEEEITDRSAMKCYIYKRNATNGDRSNQASSGFSDSITVKSIQLYSGLLVLGPYICTCLHRRTTYPNPRYINHSA